ncbi:DUF1003 domain-containing protein [Flavobacterium sp. Fl-77]|uniref:DUF1003 domain-containing protein n=1 Tax=Flavobacterium flavipigmentatum TaxID=2893884 RepID=A0AAJ2SFU6_9FLAO|nr:MULTISPECIES: DUF1003 domain-containing protein [unclassified Flavobacterium]MDX6181663.1 DUF1003 domain-containing protein [Flavobacterium sp. Fl-33]MDX6185303.1 DUF1003 domain-containing protein [Flavobacterium sp. Fl-77]UFH37409.1 DUF1003 domain-containing protein [Flavobacterium sp. F-70]
MKNNSTFKSAISNIDYPEKEKISGKSIHDPVLGLIVKDFPSFCEDDFIAIKELNTYRQKYISNYLSTEIGALSDLEKSVMESLREDKSIVSSVEDENENRSFGQKIADKVADFGGSWTFILSFLLFIVLWIAANVYILLNKGFDPYPFILLNLILSCIAALQAPVIMMSQNRQEEKDRTRAKKDYMINLKSELEIRMIHDKIDHLIMHQQQELIEIQKVQIEMMNDILNQIKK